jgi:hypothetical protein
VLAWNQHEVTRCCLERVRASGFDGELVLCDNGSSPPLADLARQYDCRHVRYRLNRYVNSVWNDLLATTRADYLTLLNNDCLVRDRYLSDLPRAMRDAGLALAAPTCLEVDDITAFCGTVDAEYAPPEVDPVAKRDGHVMTIEMAAWRRHGRPIPRVIRVWYGDDWIWGLLREAGCTCGQWVNRSCISESSHRGSGRTIRSSRDVARVIERDRFVRSRMRRLMELSVLAGAEGAHVLAYFDRPPGPAGAARQAFRALRQWWWLR